MPIERLNLVGVVGEEITLHRLLEKREALERAGEVEILLSSIGGSAFEGLAIYDYLRTLKAEVIIDVVGLVASAASIILMAADKIRLHKGSTVMLHRAWTTATGNEEELEKVVELLRDLDARVIRIYSDRLGWPEDLVRDMMEAETWLAPEDFVGVPGVEVVEAEALTALIAACTRKFSCPRGATAQEQDEKESVENLVQREEKMDEIVTLKEQLEALKQAVEAVSKPQPKIEASAGGVDRDGRVVLPNGRVLHSLAQYLEAAVRSPEAVKAAVTPVDPATGKGLAVPKVYVDQLFWRLVDEATLIPRATIYGSGTRADVYVPRIDDPAQYGVAWRAQGAELPETDPDFGALVLKPKVLGGVTYLSMGVGDEIGAGLEAQIRAYVRDHIVQVADYAFINGDGQSNKPVGLLHSTGAVKVNRDQAGKVTAVDVANMLAKALPSAEARMVWLAHPTVRPQLAALTTEAAGRLFLYGNVVAGIPDTLAGKPVYYTGALPTLDSADGDLILVDPSAYAIHGGMGVEIALSLEAGFGRASVAMRAMWYTDGVHAQKAPYSGLSTCIILKKK